MQSKNNKYIKEIVNSLRNPICYKEKCINETNLLHKCIYCKKYLSSNQWGPLLEKHVKKIFFINKPINNLSGDGNSKNNKNIEIKISLGQKNGQFNFVQIRPDHNIDFYIFMCYNMYDDKIGKIYWFLCPANKLYKLILLYGEYAHGTKEKLGDINSNNMFGHNYEYALRPNPISKGIKNQLWNKLIKRFLCDEEYIREILNY